MYKALSLTIIIYPIHMMKFMTIILKSTSISIDYRKYLFYLLFYFTLNSIRILFLNKYDTYTL